MTRQVLFEHLRRTRFAPGDREAAQRDAHRIADHLRKTYGATTVGIGSAFVPVRPFRHDSDIDLVVRGLPPERYFRELSICSAMTSFPLDLIPWEDANALMRRRAREEGVAF